MSYEMTDLEKKLCCFYNKKYGVYTGNGTTAMYISFLALNLQNKKVLFPSITCTNPINAAIYAGYEVVFCDVNMSNFTMDIESLKNTIEKENVGIVVPTHIYGHMCDVQKIKEMCNKEGIIVLEDSAQTIEMSNVDLSVTSFGHTKIFETSDGGGIVLCNDENLFNRIRSAREQLKPKPNKSELLFDDYRSRYYEIIRKSTSQNDRNSELIKLFLSSKDTFIYDSRNNTSLLAKMENREYIYEERRKKEKLYWELIEKKYIKLPTIDVDKTVCWRFSYLYLGNRNLLLEKARKQGIDISSWYPDVSQIFNNIYFENSQFVQDHIVNLWISEDYSEKEIRNNIKQINELMEECINE